MSIKFILDFLKTHWISLTSGVVSLGAIAVLALGMTSKAVVEEMQKVISSAAEIQTLKGDPKNQDTINAEKERLEKFKEQYEAAIKVAASINERKVLMDGVFPNPKSDEVRYRFQEAYRARLAKLPGEMNGGGPPTPQELQDAADEIADERRRKGLEEPEPTVGGPPIPPAPTAPPAARPGDRQPGAAMMAPPPPTTPGAEKTANLQEEAAHRAAIRKALSIQLYAESFGPRNAFQVSPVAVATEPPAADDMWYAQVGLWIQEDVVRAIREVNEDVAAKLDPKEANVGRMPVKHLISIRVPGYLTSQGGLVRFEGAREAGGQLTQIQNDLPQVFTNRVGDENFDVVRFTVKAVVDQRELLRLPDRITRTNFYQLVDIDYTTTLPITGVEAQAFHYGDGPVVLATYEFEGFLARKVYLDLMPQQVQTALGIAKKGG